MKYLKEFEGYRTIIIAICGLIYALPNHDYNMVITCLLAITIRLGIKKAFSDIIIMLVEKELQIPKQGNSSLQSITTDPPSVS